MKGLTNFIQRGHNPVIPECTIDGLYTPVESLTQILLNGKRIEHLAWEDDIDKRGIIRTIYFDYWKEPAAAVDQEDTTKTKIPYRH